MQETTKAFCALYLVEGENFESLHCCMGGDCAHCEFYLSPKQRAEVRRVLEIAD